MKFSLKKLIRAFFGAEKTASSATYFNGMSNYGDSNSDIRRSRPIISSRVRELVENMPWLDQAISGAVAFRVGEGFQFRPNVRLEDGTTDRKTNQMLRARFERWAETAEINGRDSFGDIQQLAVRQMCECGEALMVHRYTRDGYRIQCLEPDVLQALEPADNIDQGIEFDPKTNRFLKFHMVNTYSTPNIAQKEYTVDAGDVIFLYKCGRPWQRRGISPLASTVITAADLDQYQGNEIAAQQMASRWLAFITDPNEESFSDEAKKRHRTETLENLQLEFMPPGKTIQLAPGAARPTTGLQAFQTMFLRILAAKLNVPFHVISQDYGGLNYNTLREVRNNLVHLLKPEWAYLVQHLLRPVYQRWMDVEVATGNLELKGYFTPEGREHWRRVYFLPPGIESPDALRDIKAVVTGIQSGLRDPNDYIMSQGEDPDETLEGIRDFLAKCKEYEIPISLSEEPKTAIQEEPVDTKEE